MTKTHPKSTPKAQQTYKKNDKMVYQYQMTSLPLGRDSTTNLQKNAMLDNMVGPTSEVEEGSYVEVAKQDILGLNDMEEGKP